MSNPPDFWLPTNDVAAHKKLRYFSTIGNYADGMAPSLEFKAEIVEYRADMSKIRTVVAPGYDLSIAFDQNNPKHVAVFALLNEIKDEALAATGITPV